MENFDLMTVEPRVASAFEKSLSRVIGDDVLAAFKKIVNAKAFENRSWSFAEILQTLAPVSAKMLSFEVLFLDQELPLKIPQQNFRSEILNADFSPEELRSLDAKSLAALLIFATDLQSSFSLLQADLNRSFPPFESLRNAFHQLALQDLGQFIKSEAPSEKIIEWEKLRSLFQSLLPPTSEQPYCTDAFKRLRVNAEGDVFPCCYQRSQPMGNLFNSSIEEIIHGEFSQDLRFSVSHGILHPSCRIACPQNFRPKTLSVQKFERIEFLDIDPPNTHCNVGGTQPNEKNPACLMCERDALGYRFEKDSADEVLVKIRPLLSDLKNVHIQGVAEVFWKDLVFDYLDLLEYEKAKAHLHISTTSNATVFTPARQMKWIKRIRSSGIGFSIDAADPETYVKIRRLDMLDKVHEHLLHYTQLLKDHPGHVFRIINNINKLNAAEIYGMVEFANRTCAYEIEFQLTSDNGKCSDIIIFPGDQEFKEIVSDQLERAAKDFPIRIVKFRGMEVL
jgi:MoaA/NifB/PqqE/SkfB family radical SAM enzyme